MSELSLKSNVNGHPDRISIGKHEDGTFTVCCSKMNQFYNTVGVRLQRHELITFRKIVDAKLEKEEA